jgi:hypothetical protein
MNTPFLQKRLVDLLSTNIQLLYGMIKSGGVSIDKTACTVTITTPYQYNIEELIQQRDEVLLAQDQYLNQVRTESQDPNAVLPYNESMMFSDILKMYDIILQQLN